MGNLESTQFSSAELKKTEQSDREWLKIATGYLSNQAFVIHQHIQGVVQDGFAIEPGILAQTAGLVPDQEGKLDVQSTLSNLMQLLASAAKGIHSGPLRFLNEARFGVVAHLYSAIVRERAREQLRAAELEAKPKQTSEDAKSTTSRLSPAISTGIRLLAAVLHSIRSHITDPHLVVSFLPTISELLLQLPHSSLFGLDLPSSKPEHIAASQCFTLLAEWLFCVLATTMSCHGEDASVSAAKLSVRRQSLTALLSLARARASLRLYLGCIHAMLECEQLSLPIREFVQQHALILQPKYPLSAFSKADVDSRFHILWDVSTGVDTSTPPSTASIACDGAYVYIHGNNGLGLVKVGTGNAGTVAGKVYAHRSNFRTNERGWLAAIGSRLYYRSPHIAPACVLVLAADDLSDIGTVTADGAGTVSTNDNRAYGLAPECDPTQQNEVAVGSPQHEEPEETLKSDLAAKATEYSRPHNRSPMTSDGRYIYIISQLSETPEVPASHDEVSTASTSVPTATASSSNAALSHDTFAVDTYDPMNGFAHIRRVVLQANASPPKSVSDGVDEVDTAVLPPAALQQGIVLTNGVHLAVVMPPVLAATCLRRDSNEHLMRTFHIAGDGAAEDYAVDTLQPGTALCYDGTTGMQWMYAPATNELVCYRPVAAPPPHLSNEVDLVALVGTNEAATQKGKEKTSTAAGESPVDAGVAACQLLPYLARYAVNSRVLLERNRTKQSPFVLELSTETFELLLRLMTTAATAYWSEGIADSVTRELIVLTACVQILSTNLAEVLRSCADPSECGLGRTLSTSTASEEPQSLVEKLSALLFRLVFIPSKLHVADGDTKHATLISAIQRESLQACIRGLDVFVPVGFQADFIQHLVDTVPLDEGSDKVSFLGTMVVLREARNDFLVKVLWHAAANTTASSLVLPPTRQEAAAYAVRTATASATASSSRHTPVPREHSRRLRNRSPSPRRRESQAASEDDDTTSSSSEDEQQVAVTATSEPATGVLPVGSEQLHFGLLESLLAFCTAFTHKRIASPSTPVVSQDMQLYNAALALLAAIQRDLLSRAAFEVVDAKVFSEHSGKSAPSAPTPSTLQRVTVQYAQVVLHRCHQLLDIARTVIATNSVAMPVVLGHIRESLVGVLALPLVVGLYGLGNRSLYFAAQLTSPIASLMSVIDAVASMSPSSTPDDIFTRATRYTKIRTFVVESSHPYSGAQHKDTLVMVPGAACFVLHFDPQCKVANSNDTLRIYRDIHKQRTLRTFSQDSKFPTQPIVLGGDTLVLTWHTDGSGREWGFKVTIEANAVEGIATPDSVSWLLDLQASLATLAGILTTTLIFGDEVDADERACGAWLVSELLSGYTTDDFHKWKEEFYEPAGILDSDLIEPLVTMATPGSPSVPLLSVSGATTPPAGETAFLSDLLAMRSESDAAVLHQWMSRMLLASAQYVKHPQVTAAVRAVIAVILKHHRLVDDAAVFARIVRASPNVVDIKRIPPELSKAWLYGKKLYDWLATRRAERVAKLSTPPAESDEHDPIFAELATSVIDKAQFLLTLPGIYSTNSVGSSSGTSSPVRRSPSIDALQGRPAATSSTVATKLSALTSTPTTLQSPLKMSRSTSNELLKSSASIGALSSSTKRSIRRSDQMINIRRSLRRWRFFQKHQAAGSGVSPMSTVLPQADVILGFVQSPSVGSVDILRKLLQRRRHRARARVFGLKALCAMLKATNRVVVRQALLNTTGDALRNQSDANTGATIFHRHYLNCLETCDFALIDRVRTAFSEFLLLVTALLREYEKDADRNTTIRLMALNAVVLDFREPDHEFISRAGLFPILRRMMQPDSQSPVDTVSCDPIDTTMAQRDINNAPNDTATVRLAAWNAFRLLATTCLGKDDDNTEGEDETGSTSGSERPEGLNQLQASVVDLVLLDLRTVAGDVHRWATRQVEQATQHYRQLLEQRIRQAEEAKRQREEKDKGKQKQAGQESQEEPAKGSDVSGTSAPVEQSPKDAPSHTATSATVSTPVGSDTPVPTPPAPTAPLSMPPQASVLPGIDPSILAALPEEIRAEVLAGFYEGTPAAASTNTATTSSFSFTFNPPPSLFGDNDELSMPRLRSRSIVLFGDDDTETTRLPSTPPPVRSSTTRASTPSRRASTSSNSSTSSSLEFPEPPTEPPTSQSREFHLERYDDNYAYDLLVLLLALSRMQHVREYLAASANAASHLLSLAASPAPHRLRRIAFRLCRRVLPGKKPGTVGVLAAGATGSAKSGEPIGVAQFLLDVIGEGLCPYVNSMNAEQPDLTMSTLPRYIDLAVAMATSRCNGYLAQVLAAEAVMLVRTLLTNPLWNATFTEVFSKVLMQVNPLVVSGGVMPLGDVDRSLKHMVAVFAVLGGHVDTLRIGGRVHVADVPEKAIVVRYDPSMATLSVMFESSNQMARNVGVDQVTPVAEVPFVAGTTNAVGSVALSTPPMFVLEAEHVPAYTAFLYAASTMPALRDLPWYAVLERHALHSLKSLLENPANAALFVQAGALSPLLDRALLASKPMTSSTRPPLDTLEYECRRLCEVVYEAHIVDMRQHIEAALNQPGSRARTLFDENATASSCKATAASAKGTQRLADQIPFSAFRHLNVPLPTRLDTSSANFMRIDGSGRVATYHGPHSRVDDAGIARADRPIPDSLAAYYFEIEIENEGGNGTVSIGLFPLSERGGGRGVDTPGGELVGLPGWFHGSVGYHNDGRRYRNGERRDYGPRFGIKDVIGCFLNRVDGTVTFTKNGHSLGTACTVDVSTGSGRIRWYPVVGVHTPGGRVRVNFGQQPFRFDFAAFMAERFGAKSATGSRGGDAGGAGSGTSKKMTREQEKLALRKAMAADLMTLGYALKLCMVALEQNRDDTNAAAMWLMDNSAQYVAEHPEVLVADEDGNVDQPAESGQSQAPVSTPAESDDDDINDDDEESDYEAASANGGPPTELFDSDEYEAERGMAGGDDGDGGRRHRLRRMAASVSTRLEQAELRPGRLVALPEISGEPNPAIVALAQHARIPLSHFHGTGGVIRGVDTSAGKVMVEFYDADSDRSVKAWCDQSLLERPTCAPVREYLSRKSAGPGIVYARVDVVVENNTALSLNYCRQALVVMLTQLSPTSAAARAIFTEPKRLKEVISLALANTAGSGDGGDRRPQETPWRRPGTTRPHANTLSTLRAKLCEFIAHEQSEEHNTTSVKGKEKAIDEPSLRQLLVDECVAHLSQAMRANLPILVEESSHPYEKNTFVKKPIHIEGASELLITFEPATSVVLGVDSLAFYADEGCTQLIESLAGNAVSPGRAVDDTGCIRPLVVPGDRCWFTFHSSPNSRGAWGYRFHVTPLHVQQRKRHFEAALWLLDLMLDARVDMVYRKAVFDTLVRCYRSSVSRGGKLREAIAARLCRLVQHIEHVATSGQQPADDPLAATAASTTSTTSTALPQLDRLEARVRQRLERRFAREHVDVDNFASAKLQGMIEFLVLITRAKLRLAKLGLSTPPTPGLPGWFEEVLEVADLLSAFSPNRPAAPLSDSLIRASWLNQQKQIEIRESQHPSLDDYSEGDIVCLNAQSLSIMLDPKCCIPHWACLKLLRPKNMTGNVSTSTQPSGDAVEYEEVASITNNSDPGTFTVAGDRIRYRYTLLSTPSTHEATCHRCSRPISGVRYWCINCLNTSFCADCEASLSLRGVDTTLPSTALPDHPEAHLLLVLPTPVDRALPSNVPVVYPGIGGDIHRGFTCGHCGANPIRGVRYKCATCLNFNLCGQCFGNGTAPPHYRNHVFLLIRHALAPAQRIPTFPMVTLYDHCWGFRIYVESVISQGDTDELVASHAEEISEFARLAQSPEWPLEGDLQLVGYANQLAARRDCSPFLLAPRAVFAATAAEYGPVFSYLAGRDNRQLQARFALLQVFNAKLLRVLPLIGMTTGPAVDTLSAVAARLSALRGLVFTAIKNELWAKIVEKTTTDKPCPAININRHRAKAAVAMATTATQNATGEPNEAVLAATVFGQVYAQLRTVPPELLRQAEKAFSVTLVGEGANDAGGPYNETLSDICAELMGTAAQAPATPLLPLFIPCSNGKHETGENREVRVPNPALTSAKYLSLYEFLGKLMGVALRTKHYLALDLPSLLFARLVRITPTRADLEMIDKLAVNTLENFENPEKMMLNEETFADAISLNFETTSADGRTVELIAGGSAVPLTWNNRLEYVRLLEKYKLSEYDVQIDAIRRGLGAVVPLRFLQMFTPSELERAICGQKEIDIALLRANTIYTNCSPSDPHIIAFWKVLESFSPEDKVAFLRFVWGRARLPNTSDEFVCKFDIRDFPLAGASGGAEGAQETTKVNVDTYLPTSHTCFFNIDLPAYSSEAVMRRQLLYAIHQCPTIENDFIPGELEEEEEL